MSQTSNKWDRRMALVVGLALATLALAATIIYLEVRGPSSSYVDGYNFAVAFTHGLANRRPQHYPRVDADSSCSVWSFSNAGGVPPGDIPRQWRQGCEAALTSEADSTIGP
jgi:hypothetical protein